MSPNKIDTPVINAFTIKYDGRIKNRLTTQITLHSGDKEFITVALWDTGATASCISKNVVQNLELIPTGKTNIHTPSGYSERNTYLLDMTLPNNVRINDVRAIDSEIADQGLDALIGMNIICMGDLSLSNKRETVFTFRVPSVKTTDYVKEINLQKLIGTHGKGKRKHK